MTGVKFIIILRIIIKIIVIILANLPRLYHGSCTVFSVLPSSSYYVHEVCTVTASFDRQGNRDVEIKQPRGLTGTVWQNWHLNLGSLSSEPASLTFMH